MRDDTVCASYRIEERNIVGNIFASPITAAAASVCALITLQRHQNEGKHKINRHFRSRIFHYNFVLGVSVCIVTHTHTQTMPCNTSRVSMECLITVDFRHNELFSRSLLQPDFHTLILRWIHSSRNKSVSKNPLIFGCSIESPLYSIQYINLLWINNFQRW